MDIATFETLSNDEKNKVFAELSRPKIEKKNAYTLIELKAMNDVERFSILSDEEKQKVLNKERPLRNASVENTFTVNITEEYRLFSPDITKDVEYNILVSETFDNYFLLKEKGMNSYTPVRYVSQYERQNIGDELYNACMKELRKLGKISTKNF